MKNKKSEKDIDQAALFKRLQEIIAVMAEVGDGALEQQVAVTSDGALGELELAFNEMITNLRHGRQATIELAQENARLSELRNIELETIARVSELTAKMAEPDKFVQQAIDLIREAFGLYHAHTYLLDQTGGMLNLVAGTGQAGRQMIAEKWHIPLDRVQSLVAQAARARQGVIVNDVRKNSDFMPHELLPDTRSEMAVPMIAGDRLLGVLDVQADELNRFGNEDIRVYTTLAAQIAVALENARQRDQAQSALAEIRQSQNLMRSIIDATPDWIFIKDQEHRYRLVNEGYARALHLSPEDFIGKNDLELGFPEELVKGNPEKGIRGFWADDRLVMESGETQVYPSDPATIDGKVHTFHTIKTPLRDAEGTIWGVLAFARDITERKQIEEALRENETRLSEALALARLGYWQLDVETQMFTFNDQIYDLYGTTAEQEGGYQMPADEFSRRFVHPDEAATVGPEIQRALETTDPDYRAEFVNRIIRADGEQIYVAVQIRIRKDEQGRTIKMYGTNQDITEQKQAEFLLNERVKELNCLNDIGREMEGAPPVPQLLQWVTERVPPAMQHPDLCLVAIEFDDQVYGKAEAIELRSQMTHGLYVGGEVVGRVYVAYTEKRDFLNEESALLGGIATRLSGYIENRRLFETMQRRAEREQLINNISQRIQSKMTMETALQTAVEELGQAFRARYTRVELIPPAKTDGNGKLSKETK